MPANQRKLGVVLNYIYLGVNALANLLYVPILLGTIGASQYGLYQTIGSFVAYLSVLSRDGLNGDKILFFFACFC